ncbi:MAG TPA: 2-oxoglutarate dehydrogenase E1 component [Phycisphaerales bacterium]|nr:2-oxoglutarate dehydrogenase E1 component [Phycisphaerales bacterium]
MNSSQASLRANRPAVNGWSAEYLDAQYRQYLADPAGMPDDLRQFFMGFELAEARGPVAGGADTGASALQRKVDALVKAYRDLGHLGAKVDPFERKRDVPKALEPGYHGITEADLDQTVGSPISGGAAGSGAPVRVRDLIARLESIYCGSIGVEFMHIPSQQERNWFLDRFEGTAGPRPMSAEEKRTALSHVIAADTFDRFLGKRYQGKKRFSLEGGEGLIPLLKFLTQRAGELGTEEIILGMPHRGRLSVLRNYLGKDLHKLFTEFEDSWSDGVDKSGGDVKYHRGYSGDQPLWGAGEGRKVHLSMLNNPSHLESVDPVVMGRCRAMQDRLGDTERRRAISLLLHGDAALPGQGVVAECLNMSQLEGYTVGGTIHVVVNNLVGFTTDWEDSRSTPYCTDIAKIVNCPVLHVNGDDVDAVVRAARIAAEFRHEFRRDVFIDLVCFRRFGHNEQDEPGFTQPVLYALVRQHPGVAEKYTKRLIAEGALTPEQAQAMVDRVTAELEEGQTLARTKPVNPVPPPGGGLWDGFVGTYSFDSPRTAVSREVVAEVCAAMGRVPEGFNVHARLKNLLVARAGLPQTKNVSHADAEQIAIGTLLLDGYAVRLSGQDSRRGTFTQRHSVYRDERTAQKYVPLNNIRPDQKALYSPWDSPLSEFAVMGFDYGYSRGAPRTLVMWEGQFGDFVNGAQVMLDQWLASSEIKWSRWAGLVLLLPHGYEGAGPEHSSARLERFLQLCADENMEVVYPSTGAQMFHLLRRQMLRKFRKPLIVMTPKKYLRVETSSIDELSEGAFQHLIDDPKFKGPTASVTRVIYCSGKIYHELNDRREANGNNNTAIVRVEQFYPFNTQLAKAIDARYPAQAQRVYVQEEPRNAGGYLFCADVFREQLGINLGYIGRPASATPATGSEHRHKEEQDRLLTAAVGAAGGEQSAPKEKPARGAVAAKG